MELEVVYRPGEFVWHELFTPDVEHSIAYYEALLGWQTRQVEVAGGAHYTVFRVGDVEVGGCMETPPAAPSCWAEYVSVDDVDRSARRARRRRGRVKAGPRDVGQVGRFVTLADPLGATINAWKSSTGDNPPPAESGAVPGAFCWEELQSPDPERVAPFYSDVFGWTPAEELGEADAWVWKAGTTAVGGTIRIGASEEPSWLSYIAVEQLEPVLERAVQLGGRVVRVRCGPAALGTVGIIEDPTGARVGLVEW